MTETYRFGDFTTDVVFLHIQNLMKELQAAGLTVFDENTVNLFPDAVGNAVVLPAGETGKNWNGVELILEHAVKASLTRSDVIAGAGGGVVCDMTAFAASIYMRGTGLYLVPTTLLAMVDASLGGKTGINFAGFKNMAGTFYPAGKLFIAPEFLLSLPDREFRSGLAEVIKTAMLGDEDLFTMLESNRDAVLRRDTDLLSEIVMRCIKVKGRIVESDLRERSIRAHLNLGHTFGHALESVTDFIAYSHGEAVAWGIGKALKCGVRLGITDTSYAERAALLLMSFGFDLEIRLRSPEALLEAMNLDKKKGKEGIRFVLQKNICDTLVMPLSCENILPVLTDS